LDSGRSEIPSDNYQPDEMEVGPGAFVFGVGTNTQTLALAVGLLWADSGPTRVVLERTGVSAKAVVPLRVPRDPARANAKPRG